MILRRERLRAYPAVFEELTGITPTRYAEVLPELLSAFATVRRQRLDRPGRRRAVGGGDDFDLEPEDQFLLTIIWLRHYGTQQALGFLFGVSDSTALRAIRRCLPILEAQGKDTMRTADPGPRARRGLGALLRAVPELAEVLGTTERGVWQPERQSAPEGQRPAPGGQVSRPTDDLSDCGRISMDRLGEPAGSPMQRPPSAVGDSPRHACKSEGAGLR